MFPTGYLKNEKTGRFHSISFRLAPLPGGIDESRFSAQRYRSIGHHTDGFDTLELAQAWVKDQPNLSDVGVVWSWDGEDVPAMTEFFPPVP